MIYSSRHEICTKEDASLKHKLIRAVCLCLALALFTPQVQAAEKLKKGSKGAEVLQLQSALKNLGYSITVDGSYGNGTMNTVKTFQKQHGLKADGVAGVQTLGLLYALAPSSGAQAASAADSTNATVRTANGGSLKFRAKASTASNVVVHCYLPNGTRVEILSRGKTWCKARYNGKTGYLMTEYLAFDSAAPAAATFRVGVCLDKKHGSLLGEQLHPFGLIGDAGAVRLLGRVIREYV